MPDLYHARAEDWEIGNATFEQLLETLDCQDFYLVIFTLASEKQVGALRQERSPPAVLPSPSVRFWLN